MNTRTTIEELANWIDNLKELAINDDGISVSWFEKTKNSAFSIVGGWSEGFNEDCSDILYMSKADSAYAMCVKIIINESPYAYYDFDILGMPLDADGDVDDTCIAIERSDSSLELARFLLAEHERISNESRKLAEAN